jgi:hypothetical protein
VSNSSPQEQWFAHLLSTWEKREREMILKLSDERIRNFWFADEHSRQLVRACSEDPRCFEQLRELFRLTWIDCCRDLMLAFDGNSSLAERGIELAIGDQEDGPFSDHLHADFLMFLDAQEGMQNEPKKP